MNAWPEIESLEIKMYGEGRDYSPMSFIDFLQYQKKKGWKPPSLKLFRLVHTSPRTESDNILQLFKIIPTLKSIDFIGFKTIAQFQKALIHFN